MSERTRPIAKYVEQILALLINIELNKYDNERAKDGFPLTYGVDADVVGFYMRPKGHQARYANMGFIDHKSAEETVQAILTGELIFSENLPGRKAGKKSLIFPAHALEISEMREAIRRSHAQGVAGDPDHVDHLGEYQESLGLLADLLSTKLTPFETFQITTGTVPEADEARTSTWAAELDRSFQPIAVNADPKDVARRERTIRRDAQVLSRAEALRDHLLGSDNATEFLFISGSRHVHAAFPRASIDGAAGEIENYWIRHPLQYTPYLNLVSQGVEERNPKLPPIFQRLEDICREALQDWEQPLSTFRDLLAARSAAFIPPEDGTVFALRCERWNAKLPRDFFNQKYDQIAQHWVEVAAAAASVLSDTLARRKQRLDRVLGAGRISQGSLSPESAVEGLRHVSLSLDASRDMARSIQFYADQVRSLGIVRRVNAPIRQADGNLVDRAITRAFHEFSPHNRQSVADLFDLIDMKGDASVLIESAALVALRAHQWQQARRWAHELVDKGRRNGRTLVWSLPSDADHPSVHAKNAWLIRCIAGRYGGFADDTYEQLIPVAAGLAEYAHKMADHEWIAISEAEKLAISLFGAMQLRFGSESDKIVAAGAPSFASGDVRCFLLDAQDVAAKISALMDGGLIDSDIGRTTLLQVSANIAITASIYALIELNDGHALDEFDDLIGQAAKFISGEIARTKAAGAPNIHQLSLAMIEATREFGSILARTTIRLWAANVPIHSEQEAVKFDRLLKRALMNYGLVQS